MTIQSRRIRLVLLMSMNQYYLMCSLLFIAILFHYQPRHGRAAAFNNFNWKETTSSTFVKRRQQQQQQQQQRPFLRSVTSSSDENIENDVDDMFKQMQEKLFQKEIEAAKEQRPWLSELSTNVDSPSSIQTLPFDCTACGKCCRTVGNVYMDPEEIVAASKYVNISTNQFIESYADKVIDVDKDTLSSNRRKDQPNIPWITVKNKVSSKDGLPACEFLDLETNYCKIYEVRPIQCSTYPFWSNILASKANWNDEVRRHGDDDKNEASNLPPWTPEGGGCEGMKVMIDNHDHDIAITSAAAAEEEETVDGIPTEEAMKQLILYERNHRRVPR